MYRFRSSFHTKLLCSVVVLLSTTTPQLAAQPASSGCNPVTWTREQDHAQMMVQLGITAIRPGPSGRAEPGSPNAANYDPSIANPYPELPDPLTLNDGHKVTSAATWNEQRRPEIVEEFSREVLGRVPANVPGVTWEVTETIEHELDGIPVLGKLLIGRVDNSSCPEISVEIEMAVVVPTNVDGKVPVLMMFGRPNLPRPDAEPAPQRGGPYADPPSQEQLVRAGWGYATLNPRSVQADNGAGLTRGIVGLVNKGQARKPDDWGALRAWAWGASRGLDYLETDAAVDATNVGIEGVSRYGKAALVAMAYEPRFAMVLVGSSGEGGASKGAFGSMNAGDLPVDAHQLIALCAPRPTFISYGIPERGDANWLDQQGSYMATVAAGPVFKLLGAKDIGDERHYNDAKMPAVNVGLLDGQLAWRQHDGGHEDRTNMKHFIAWASNLLNHKLPASTHR